MQDVNVVVLCGRLTRDAELKYTAGGLPICSFSLALNRAVKKNDQWVDDPTFIDVTLFGKLGESVSKYLLKGGQVVVHGGIKQERWEKDGQKHSRHVIIAEESVF
jgi:single-strand DNA-binding protein